MLVQNIKTVRHDFNTCVACNAKLIVGSNFMRRPDGKVVPRTNDHIILKALGGRDCAENFATMCRDCNIDRGSKFAECTEYLDWLDAGRPVLKYRRNYTLLPHSSIDHSVPFIGEVIRNGAKPMPPKAVFDGDIRMDPNVKIPVPQNKGSAKLVRTFSTEHGFFAEYKHPLFGLSTVKIAEGETV